MRGEEEENKRLQAYLDLTYRVANEQMKGKWTYADAEEFFLELQRRKGHIEEQKEPPTEISNNSPTKKLIDKFQKEHGSQFQTEQKLLDQQSNTNTN